MFGDQSKELKTDPFAYIKQWAGKEKQMLLQD